MAYVPSMVRKLKRIEKLPPAKIFTSAAAFMAWLNKPIRKKPKSK